MIQEFIMGLSAILEDPFTLVLLLCAAFIGLIGGGIPGISGLMLVVLLLPLTYKLGAIPSLAFLTVVYAAAVYGGSATAVLFNIPGAPESIMTTLDGYKMTLKGRAKEALTTAIFASFTGGLIGSLLVIFFTPPLAKWAINFATPEYFALAFFGLSLTLLLGGDKLSNLLAIFIGIFIATIGLDPLVYGYRFSSPVNPLGGGIELVTLVLGAFALSEVLRLSETKATPPSVTEEQLKLKLPWFPTIKWFKNLWRNLLPTALIGSLVGFLPGVGATTGSLFGYNLGRVTVRKDRRDLYGTGIEEGVASPESANNAAACTAYIPLLAFGIPGSGTTAVLIGAFILNGLRPGPLLFFEQPKLTWAIIVSLLIANLLILVYNKVYVRTLLRVLQIPTQLLLPIIAVLCIIGAFAATNDIFSVWVMFTIGLIAYVLGKIGINMAPMVIGFVLAQIAEVNLRRALISFTILEILSRPITILFLAMAIIIPLWPVFVYIIKRTTGVDIHELLASR